MTSRIKLHLGILSIAAGIGAAMGLIPSMVLAQTENRVVVGNFYGPSDVAQQARAHWTEARMRDARSMAVATMPGAPSETWETESPAESPTAITPGGPGEPPSQVTLGQAEEGAITPLAGTAPYSYTRYRLFPDSGLVGLLQIVYKQFPYRLVGKLFGTIPGIGDYVCSGAVINSANRSVVWTAGSCLYTPGIGYHANVVFVPARRAGANPYGIWAGIWAGIPAGWTNSSLREYDLGALVVGLGGNGNLTIGDTIGGLGFLANAPRQQHWHILGYPATLRNPATTPPGAQFDGEHQEICAASWAADDQPSGNAANPKTVGVGCDQTAGVSGAPYIVNFSGVVDQNNFVNGQASYRYSGPNPPENLKLFSPYFGDAALEVFNAAQAVPVP